MKNPFQSFMVTLCDDNKRILTALTILMAVCSSTLGCTSALVGVQRGADGRWLLWKHRDSGHPDNYVRSFAATDSTLAYVALFNASDTASNEAWIGFNEAGFAVMNTASYNIPAPRKDWQDREGLLMTHALRHCRTIEDFYLLLKDHDGPLGVQANFGAFDAEGNGAYFETSDNHVTVFPLDSTGILTRTNYSVSGGPRNRLGLSRHKAENHLVDSVMTTERPWASAGRLSAEDFIETLSRSFYLPGKGIDLLDGTAPSWPDTGDVIPRRSSCASVVIEGPLSGENPAETMIMWTAIGFPTLSVVEPVTIDSVPMSLLPVNTSGHSPACDEANHLRDKAFISVNQHKVTTKPSYDFNLQYLREAVTKRRSISLLRYFPARSDRK